MSLRSRPAVYLIAFVALLAAFFFGMSQRENILSEAIEINWPLLSTYDYLINHVPEDLKSLDGKIVRLPGFIVPLDDDQKAVTEFLLVPAPQMCVHVPPPPPNQIVFVRADSKQGLRHRWSPIWVAGRLKITPKKTDLGQSGHAGAQYGPVLSSFEIELLEYADYE